MCVDEAVLFNQGSCDTNPCTVCTEDLAAECYNGTTLLMPCDAIPASKDAKLYPKRVECLLRTFSTAKGN